MNSTSQNTPRIDWRNVLQWIFVVSILSLYSLPYILLGEKAHILIHDNLDAGLVTHKLLVESGNVFASSDTLIEPLMGGLPRSTLPGEFILTNLWFWLLGPLPAYILERIIQAVIGFVGMYLLLRRHIVPGEENALIQKGVGLTFALLPFWPFGGLSVAGLPLLLYAFLNLRTDDRSWFNWLLIIAFPFYSHLWFSGVFLLILIGLILLYDLVKKRQLNWTMLIGSVLLSIIYIFTNYRLFMDLLFESSYVSHRVEMDLVGHQSLFEVVANSLTMLLYGQYHAYSLHGLIVLPVVIVCCVLMIYSRQVSKIFLLILTFLVTT
ncbi:MAG: DUF6044 family protein, partial [Chloroflexota bacterium]